MSFEIVQDYFKARIANVILFCVACVLAIAMKWNASDLAWSLWLSNLFLTTAVIVCTTVVAAKREATFTLIGAGLFVLAIAFYLAQTAPLIATLPLKGQVPEPGGIKAYYASVFVTYWMWLPISFYHYREFFFHPPNFFEGAVKTTNPVKSLVFFNVLIYVIILFHKVLRLDGFAAALVTFVLYFFFFDRDLTRKKPRN